MLYAIELIVRVYIEGKKMVEHSYSLFTGEIMLHLRKYDLVYEITYISTTLTLLKIVGLSLEYVILSRKKHECCQLRVDDRLAKSK